MFSPLYYKQLELNGRDELYSDCFFEDNIYYVSTSQDTIERIGMYLEQTYDCKTTYTIEDTVDNCMIVKFKEE